MTETNEKYIYKVAEESENSLDSIIEKSNVRVRFSMRELFSSILNAKKYIKQLSAQKQLEEAKCQNIREHHPIIDKLTPEERFAVHLYEQSQDILKVVNPKLEEFEKAVLQDETEAEEIKNQIGIAVPLSSLDEGSQANTNGRQE